MNWFIFTCGALQFLGSLYYFKCGLYKFGMLYFLYSFTNFVLFACKGE